MATPNAEPNTTTVLPGAKDGEASCGTTSEPGQYLSMEHFISHLYDRYPNESTAKYPTDSEVLDLIQTGEWGFDCSTEDAQTQPELCSDKFTSVSKEPTTSVLCMFDPIELSGQEAEVGHLTPPQSAEMTAAANIELEDVVSCDEVLGTTCALSPEGVNPRTEGDELIMEGFNEMENFEISTLDLLDLLTSNIEERAKHGSASSSGGIQSEFDPQNYNWEGEMEVIASTMFGRGFFRNDAVQEQLRLVAKEFEMYWNNSDSVDVPMQDRSLKCFRKTIISVVNDHCEVIDRKVRRIPDFCKTTFRKWTAVEANYQNPYPSKEEILQWVNEFGLTQRQVEIWFDNFRSRTWEADTLLNLGVQTKKKSHYSSEQTSLLSSWMCRSLHNQHPRGRELQCLVEATGLPKKKVQQWFYNSLKRCKLAADK